jgi:pSer/pThr/pTyr-binding forkhead associated (FHA) protein
VSKVHAKLSWSGQAWVLRDFNSANGTYVNGIRLQPFGACVLLCVVLSNSVT